jgi:NAD(P)-dependent dehydrogenase (short-subunit alcohol dehydrogenase family)
MGLMDGKVVVITGAGRGIGRSHALRFSAEGAKVVVNDVGVEVESGPDGSGRTQPTDSRDPSVAGKVVDEIRQRGGEAIADSSDLSTFAGGSELIDAALAEYGRVDTLINNAGTLTIMMIGEIDERKLVRELAVHIVGYIGTIQAVWQPMIDQGGGTIVNTSSGFGGSGPGLTTYMAAKSGVFSLTRDVAGEGARYGIRCNALTPAARTRMSIPYWGADQTEDWDPDWASTLALYYASELSAGITGRQLSIAPGNMVREMYVDGNVLVNEDVWTPETLASRLPELLHKEPAVEALRKPPLGAH